MPDAKALVLIILIFLAGCQRCQHKQDEVSKCRWNGTHATQYALDGEGNICGIIETLDGKRWRVLDGPWSCNYSGFTTEENAKRCIENGR